MPASLRRDRRLRSTVLGFQGCLSRLPSGERKVLVLRAGVGIARPRSRTVVARLTGLSQRRVARLEHRGLRRLHALGAAGGCAASSQAATSAVAVPVSSGPSAGTPAPQPRIGVEAARESSAETQRPEGEAKLPLGIPALINPKGAGAAFDLAIIIAPLLVAGFLFVVARAVRRTT